MPDVTAQTTLDLRKRILEGQPPYTKAELAAHVRNLVAARIAQVEQPKAKGKSTKQPTANLDDLIG